MSRNLKFKILFLFFGIEWQTLFQLILVLLPTILFSTSAIAQDITKSTGVLQSEADQAATYYQNGETDRATKHQINYLKSIDFDAEPDLAWGAVSTLYQICFAPGFPGLTLSFSPSCNDSAFTFLQKLPIDSFEKAKKFLYLNSLLLAVATQDRDWLREIFADNILDHDEYLHDYSFYIDRQLLAAEGHILLKDYARARKSADKALSTILAIQTDSGGSWQVSRWLLGAISIYQKLNDFKTAIGLFAAAGDLFGLSLSLNSPDSMAYYLLSSDLSLKAGYYHQVLLYSDALLLQLDRPEVDMIGKPIWRVSALSQKASACLLLGDQECVRAIIERSEFDSTIRSIDGEIKELSELTAGLSLALKVIYTSFIRDPIAEDDRLRYLKDLEVFKIKAPAPELRDVMLFAQAFLYQKTSVKKKTFVEVSRSALLRFEQSGSLPLGQIPIASLGDRILWLMTLLTLEDSEKELGEDEKALAFNMAEAISRTTISVEGDDLALIAGSDSQEKSRLVHQYLRITSRQRDNYLSLTKEFSQNLAANIKQGKVDSDSGNAIDTWLRQDISDFGVQRNRLLPQVWEQGSLVPFLPSLKEAQSSLSQDEAILFNLAFAQMRVVVCIRSNQLGVYKHLLTDAQQFNNDVKLIQYSISSANPPSSVLDTQFPVESAVRLYEALLEPAEKCLKLGDTIYSVSRHSGLPLEVLLESVPEKKGTGYILNDADWAVKKYNFSYIGSVRELIASKKIDNRPSATTGFLGIGNPLLTGVTLDGADIKNQLKRSAVGPNMDSISGLSPLPETAIELGSVLEIFNGNGKVLLGKDATESAVRRADLGNYEYISFATHGLARKEVKGVDESALVLTPVESSSQLNDGILTASELADLNLNARVVVLSACNTAGVSGGLSAPEIQSLTTALAVAGVPSSVATLTAVNSYSTRLIIESFFSSLIEKDLSVAQALAKAKVDLISSPPSVEYAHPRFWAPIVAFGNSKKSSKEPEPELLTWASKQYFGTRDAEVLKIISEVEGGTYVVFYDNPVKREDLDGTWEAQTKVAKLNNNLEIEWKWGEFGHGNSATLIPTKDSLIFPAQYVSSYSTETSKRKYTNSIHVIDKVTGKELQSAEPPENEGELSLIDGTVTNDGELVALFYSYAPSGSEKIWLLESSKNKTDFSWYEIKKLNAGNNHFPFGGFILNLGETLLIGYNVATKLEPTRVFLDEFDNVQTCGSRVDTALIWLDSKTFKKINKLGFSDFIVTSAIEKERGKVALIGTSGQLCSAVQTPRNLIVAELDGFEVIQKFADNLNHVSWGRDIIQLPSGHLLLVGSAERSFGSEGIDEISPTDYLKDNIPKERQNKSRAEDGLLILLDSDYREIGRTWTELGVDLFFNTANVSQGQILVGGKAGSKAFLGKLKINESILQAKTQTAH